MFVKVEIISIFVVKRGDVGLPRRNLSYFFAVLIAIMENIDS